MVTARGRLLLDLANVEDKRRLLLTGKRGAARRHQLLLAAQENASARVSCGFPFFSPASSSLDLRPLVPDPWRTRGLGVVSGDTQSGAASTVGGARRRGKWHRRGPRPASRAVGGRGCPRRRRGAPLGGSSRTCPRRQHPEEGCRSCGGLSAWRERGH